MFWLPIECAPKSLYSEVTEIVEDIFISEAQLEAIKFNLFIHLIFSICDVKDWQRKVMSIAAYFIN